MTKLTWSSPKLTTRTLTFGALLIAIQLCLSKLSVGPENVVKVGLGFIGTAMIGYFLGPWLGGVALVLNDLISNTVFSTGSSFFIGFTFSAFVKGVIAGLFLHRQEITWQRLAIYTFFQILISNVFFNTMWIFLMYFQTKTAGALYGLLAQRLPKEIISWPIEIIILLFLMNAIERLPIKSLNNN